MTVWDVDGWTSFAHLTKSHDEHPLSSAEFSADGTALLVRYATGHVELRLGPDLGTFNAPRADCTNSRLRPDGGQVARLCDLFAGVQLEHRPQTL